jgi:hypothetical protein
MIAGQAVAAATLPLFKRWQPMRLPCNATAFYTAIVRGANNATRIAVVEVQALQ